MQRPYIQLPKLHERSSLARSMVDGVTLETCAKLVPTPFYVTSLSAVQDRVATYQRSLHKHFARGEVHYAVKANSAPQVLAEVVSQGAGLDLVSPGELWAALRAQCPPSKICYAGVGKRSSDVLEAIEKKVGFLNVEHVEELAVALKALQKSPHPKSTSLNLRWNPSLEVETHPHLKTGALDSKFGMLTQEILEGLKTLEDRFGKQDFSEMKNFILGIHVHVGSQLHKRDFFPALCVSLGQLVKQLFALGVCVSHFDLGGGLGVGVHGVPNDGQDIEEHVENVCLELKKSLFTVMKELPETKKVWGESLENVSVAFEPGRSVVASSTVLVTQVLYTKENGPENVFVYVDAGMNDFPRPAIYGATHHVEWLAPDTRNADSSSSKTKEEKTADLLERLSSTKEVKIVGPVCESADVLSKHAKLPPIQVGDFLCYFEAGAYCRSMASHYNLRSIPAEIFVKQEQVLSYSAPIPPGH
jgi:diaminopimelate decarboxylase